ncbi:hypothetical protein DFJ58DRAFT_755727 [Suillus subalutaceus]|uniref:uncharacterized protein n=1 Tax=Suillus subalutaceus TaxID=48586 RepID=UPI001B85EA84|nr:uncharacterized protein DFJ58DRAFT_755727 [Suillus subalutaceus]KAG1876672.1 hypothetical protein DFJ58DRAFT_755727 [Suillus subalutaceus]
MKIVFFALRVCLYAGQYFLVYGAPVSRPPFPPAVLDVPSCEDEMTMFIHAMSKVVWLNASSTAGSGSTRNLWREI